MAFYDMHATSLVTFMTLIDWRLLFNAYESHFVNCVEGTILIVMELESLDLFLIPYTM